MLVPGAVWRPRLPVAECVSLAWSAGKDGQLVIRSGVNYLYCDFSGDPGAWLRRCYVGAEVYCRMRLVFHAALCSIRCLLCANRARAAIRDAGFGRGELASLRDSESVFVRVLGCSRGGSLAVFCFRCLLRLDFNSPGFLSFVFPVFLGCPCQ